MSTAVSELFKAKPFPSWFSNHRIFKKIDKVKKVFPGIGLPNCEKEVDVDNALPARAAADAFLKTVTSKVSGRIDSLNDYIEARPEMSAERKARGARCIALLESVLGLLTGSKDSSKKKSREYFIQDANGRLAIKLPIDVFFEGEERAVFREGESFFRVYNKLNELLREGRFAGMTKLEDLDSFKTFSTDNIPNNKFKVVFSSDGIEGSWDVVTMSMRGVTSCQNWDQGEYKHCTIGSLLDPFVGIVYLTSGSKFNKYGSKMMKRCLVRFVVNEKTNKPYLLLDNMYPSCDNRIINQFKAFLKSKVGDMDVIYGNDKDASAIIGSSYMPMNDIRKQLEGTVGNEGYVYDDDEEEDDDDNDTNRHDSIMSYQDFHVKNKTSLKNDKQALLFQKNSAKKANSFVKKFSELTVDAIKNSDINEFSEFLKPIVSGLQGSNKGSKNNFSYAYIAPEIGRMLGTSITNGVSKSDFINSDLYLRRIYMNYFINKTKIVNNVKVKMTRDLNARLALKQKNKLRTENFIDLIKVLLPKIDAGLKLQLKELIEKKKSVTPLPIP